LARFLGGYRGLTRDAYALDLRQFVAFCAERHLSLFEVRRSDIETFGRDLEARGRAMATIARRLCTVTGLYRYAEEEGPIAHSPAGHVRRPRIDYESHAIGLDRYEVGALIVAAGLGPAAEHALVSLLALNGLRVSEAIGADIEALGVERGHRTLTVVRKGGKTVTIPLAPRTARAVDLAVGERSSGPIFITGAGRRLDRHDAARIVRRVARRAGIAKPIGPHSLRHAFITAALDAGVPRRDVQETASPPTPARPCATTVHESPSTATPLISCPPTLRGRPADLALWASADVRWRPEPRIRRACIPPTVARCGGRCSPSFCAPRPGLSDPRSGQGVASGQALIYPGPSLTVPTPDPGRLRQGTFTNKAQRQRRRATAGPSTK
jgi:integrase/recombinase XerD